MHQALITGASQGFGRALLGALVARGWACAVDARDATALQRGDRRAGQRAGGAGRRHRSGTPGRGGGRCGTSGWTCSCTTRARSARLRCRGWPTYPLDALRRVYEVDVLAPVALTQLALPALQRAPAPTVVVLSSDAAVEAYPGWGGYGSAKAALDHIAAVLARRAPGPARVRLRPRRHAHRDAPGRLPGRGHLRPRGTRDRGAGAVATARRASRQRPVPRGGPAGDPPMTRPTTTAHPLHPTARAGRDRDHRSSAGWPATRCGCSSPQPAGRSGTPCSATSPRSSGPATSSWSTPPPPAPRRSTGAGRRPAGHRARLPPGTARRRLGRGAALARRRRADPGRARRRRAPAAPRGDGHSAGRAPGPGPRRRQPAVAWPVFRSRVACRAGWTGSAARSPTATCARRPPLAAYQTVFARDPGSAEMPSAGRPFTSRVLAELARRGVEVARGDPAHRRVLDRGRRAATGRVVPGPGRHRAAA